MDNTPILLFAAILIVAGILLAMITLTKKGGQLDVEKYRVKWLTIEQNLNKDEPSSMLLAVLNADKLLDEALREKGVKGDTMGERMKAAKATWSNANNVWSSHKLRNQIAHETNIEIGYDQARRALSGFKQALKDLGAI